MPTDPVRRQRSILRYRCPVDCGEPVPGTIVMGEGLRVRRAYRILGVTRSRSAPAPGMMTLQLRVEPMSAQCGRDEIAAGAPYWTIVWDRRERRRAP